jgi:hypothetical protein
MSSHKRTVFTNGTEKKCKILGFKKHSVVVQGKHRRIYYNSDQVKTIDYVPLEKIGVNPESQISEAFL